MNRLPFLFSILLVSQSLVTPSWAGATSFGPIWNWEDTFTPQQQNKLITWIKQSEQGLISLFGPLPFSYNVYFHHAGSCDIPVPIAHIDKSKNLEVHFRVDIDHTRETFNKDWTASHELAHLMFPYLGNKNRWFSEGLASYLQYQIMYANETMSWPQVTEKLQEHFENSKDSKQHDDVSIVELSKTPRSVDNYLRLYWGGAAYFLIADKRLFEENGMRLSDVIREYLKCCTHEKNASAISMIQTFDHISSTNVFIEVYSETVVQTGFPDTHEALDWLTNHSPVVDRAQTLN